MDESVIKELIKEFEDRAVEFKRFKDLTDGAENITQYWDGKLSEATFASERLTYLLNNP